MNKSELFGIFVSALVITDLACSYYIYIESINQQWQKLAPSFLSNSHCEFIGARAPPPKNHCFQPDLLVTTVLVLSMYRESIIQSASKSVQPVFWYSLTKKLFLSVCHFFLSFSLSSHTFLWVCISPECDILNENILAVKNCKAKQKQHC